MNSFSVQLKHRLAMEDKIEQKSSSNENQETAPGARSFSSGPIGFADGQGNSMGATSPGQESGQDHLSGDIREKTPLLAENLSTPIKDKGANLYFKKGAQVKLTGKHATNFQWVLVTGPAHFLVNKVESPAGEKSGYVPRAATTMTTGFFKDLGMQDQTPSYGNLGTDAKANPKSIILHETDSTSGKSTKDAYASRIKKGEHVGAQYLIDEYGGITLVVPANEVVGHVRGNKPKKVTKPLHKQGSKEWVGEMGTVRSQIEQYFQKINTVTIPQSTRDQLLALSDVELYGLLESNGWTIYKKIDNSSTVGIEVVGAHKTLYKADPGFSEATMANIFQLLNSPEFALAPVLKAQLLQTSQRAQIKAATHLKPEEKQKKLDQLDRDLYNLLKANGWNIYTDISGPQKYATWLLVSKLAKHFGLDVGKDVIAHNQADSKTLGEGENNMEFVRSMADIKAKMPLLEQLMKRHGIVPTGELAFLLDYKKVLASLETGKKLDPNHKDYPLVMGFFNAFYKNREKMEAVFGAMSQGESLPIQTLLLRIQTLQAELDAGGTHAKLPLMATRTLLATFTVEANVKVTLQNGQLDRLMGWEDSVSVTASNGSKTLKSTVKSMGADQSATFAISFGDLMPIAPGQPISVVVSDGSEAIVTGFWLPSETPAFFKDTQDGPAYSCTVRARK